jgi:hypothetical protein
LILLAAQKSGISILGAQQRESSTKMGSVLSRLGRHPSSRVIGQGARRRGAADDEQPQRDERAAHHRERACRRLAGAGRTGRKHATSVPVAGSGIPRSGFSKTDRGLEGRGTLPTITLPSAEMSVAR